MQFSLRFELTFANGATAVSAIYIANHIQQPLLQVLQRSSLSFLQPSTTADPLEARTDAERALYLAKPNVACKWCVHTPSSHSPTSEHTFPHPKLLTASERA